jgi:hypothetical protein
MALNGIGGQNSDSAALALERFQAIRDQAKKKIEGADNRARLADTVKQKQVELKLGGNLTTPPKPIEPQAYGRAGAMEKTDLRPKLGRYIDFMA